MEKLTGLCVLLAAVGLAVTKDTYFKEGDTLTLNVSPSYPDPITNILWKFNGNLLAEWIKDMVPEEFYRTFKGRSTLDKENGRLVVKSMSQADTGVYSVEINSNVQGVSYTVKVIKIVPELPEVVVRPLTCAVSSVECSVSCDGDTTDAEPVTYRWKMGAKDWEVSGKDFEIINIKNGHDKNITCKITNPVSEKVSATIPNPLYRGEEPEPLPVAWIVIGVLVCVALVAVGLALWKWKKYPCQNRGSHRTDIADENKTNEPLNSEQPV